MKRSILVGIPAFGQNVSAHTMQSIYGVGQLLTAKGVPNGIQWLAISDIVDARNMFLTIFYDLNPQISHLLFIDADMHFNPYLVMDMINFDQPLTGVFYAKRETTGAVVGKALNKDDTIKDTVNGFLRVAGVGGGVMLISRKVVEGIIRKFPEVIDTTEGHPVTNAIRQMGGKRLIRAFEKIKNEDGGVLSEDFSFCQRWRECGGEVWANVSHAIGHIGPFNYALRYSDFLQHKADEAAKVKQKAA